MGSAAGRYEGSLRAIIHAYKYEGRRSLAAPLAQLIVPTGRDVLRDADWVIPVPLHPWRRLARGFNQAAGLANGLGRPVAHALWRRRHTTPQVNLPAHARHANLDGAFVLSPWAPALAGRVVVLVDDVRTTGSTQVACAQALKRAGVRETRALTIAIADLRG
jgi:ComF family protein